MVSKTKAANAAALAKAGISPGGYTIPQFCARWTIAPSTYQNMRAKGRGPVETYVEGRVIITHENEADWIRSRPTSGGPQHDSEQADHHFIK